jgi:hypothetical protein
LLARAVTGAMLAGAPALGLIALSGCFIFGSPGPSAVGQGQRYSAGDPNYDAFFEALHEHQVAMGTAPEDEKKLRAPLAEEVGAEEDAAANLVAKQVKKAADKLAESGTGIKVVVTGMDEDDPDDVGVTVNVVGAEVDARAKEFLKTLEATLQGEAKIAAKMRRTRKKIQKLEGEVAALEAGIDTTFRKGGPSKKSEVRKNLADAKTLIPLMIARADEVVGAAQRFVEQVQNAANTDKGQFAAPAPPPPESVELDDKSKADKGDKSEGDKPKPKGDGSSKPPPPPSDFEP